MNNREDLIKRIANILINQVNEYEDPRITYGELSRLLNKDFKTSPRSLDTYLWSLSSACIDADLSTAFSSCGKR